MKNRFSRLTALGMLTALVVVLQMAATFIRFGSFPITLTLIPIVVVGALYGVASGGLARCVIPHCRRPVTLDDQLLLRGLAVMYRREMT